MTTNTEKLRRALDIMKERRHDTVGLGMPIAIIEEVLLSLEKQEGSIAYLLFAEEEREMAKNKNTRFAIKDKRTSRYIKRYNHKTGNISTVKNPKSSRYFFSLLSAVEWRRQSGLNPTKYLIQPFEYKPKANLNGVTMNDGNHPVTLYRKEK